MLYKIFFASLLSLITLSIEADSNHTVYIYAGPGASKRSQLQTASAVSHFLKPGYHIEYILPEQLIHDNWENQAALLIIPGGADIPYTKALNGAGNQKIRAYIEHGGSLLGICAGGYYGGAFVDFAKATPLEVQGTRELSLFPGTVRGPVLAPYVYQSEKGTRAASVLWNDTVGFPKNTAFTVYYNGGGYFVDAATKDQTTVLAFYDGKEDHPAIIECRVGLGRAILSGVHFEYDPDFLDSNDPYLQEIIPHIKDKNTLRLQLVKYILERLNL